MKTIAGSEDTRPNGCERAIRNRLASVLTCAVLFSTTLTIGAANGQDMPRVADTSHAEAATAQFLTNVFAAKSAKNVDEFMTNFAPDFLTYGDGTVGINILGFDGVKASFAKYMPNWGAGLSYPTRIVGGPESAVVIFTDTPELWGADIRIVGTIDMKDGKILRWMDYFDSTNFEAADFAAFKTPQAEFPSTFMEADVGDNASPMIKDIATRFQKALALGDVTRLSPMLSYDAVFEDMALHTELLGRPAIEVYLSRSLAIAPYGSGSALRHIVGGDQGGGFEWIGGGDMKTVIGVTVLELDSDALVSRITTTYDGRQLGLNKAKNLVGLALQP